MTSLRQQSPQTGAPHFSEYIVYVDESGDHSLESVSDEFPIFVLCFCIFKIEEYVTTVVPAMQRLKFDTFGHDAVVLHSHDIRKSKGDFRFLLDAAKRGRFLEAMNATVARSPFTIVAAIIDKRRLTHTYAQPESPYNLALKFCMEPTYAFLHDRAICGPTVHILVEQRGKREDDDLELTFRRVSQGGNYWGKMPFEVKFVSKSANSSGLQLADLVAHPIARDYLVPEQPNRAYEVIDPKIRRSKSGKLEGYGLKVFP